MDMKSLTKAEEEIMIILWDIKIGFVNEVLEKLSNPKPAYNTVSTIIRILEKKGFVAHETHGRSHKYYPIISKETYRKRYFSNFLGNYFENSTQQFASFFASGQDVSLKDLEAIKQMFEQEINRKKQENDE